MSMTTKELIQQRKKEFRTYAVPKFPIGLTHQIEMNHQAYQLVGQQTLKSSIFTNYHVVDEQGEQAPADIRTAFFTYITKFQFAEQFLAHLQFIEEQLAHQADDEVVQMVAKHEAHVGENIQFLLSQNEELVDLLTKVREEIKQLSSIQMTWTLDDLQSFAELWEPLKLIYEQRIPAIMKFREFVLNEALVDGGLPNGLAQLYEEGKSLYQYFYETIATDPARLKDLDAFIELNGVLGYVEETVPEQNVFSMWEKLLNGFLRRYSYLLVILGFIGLTIKNGFHIITALYALFLLSISFSLHLLSNATMLNKAYKKTNEQRELRMTEEQAAREYYQQAYVAKAHEPDEAVEREVELETVTARNSVIVATIGGIIFIYATLEDNLGDSIEAIIVLAGILIVIIGLLLPKQTPSKRNVILSGSGVTRGRMSIEREHMVKVESKRKGKKYEIHSKNAQYSIKFRTPEAKIKQTRAELKSWCDRHLIEFEE